MLRAFLVLVLLLLVATGCGSTEDAAEPASPARTAPAGLELAEQVAEVQAVQLYRTGDATTLPILSVDRPGERLTLEFDLLGTDGRSVSVFFYHADKAWRRDLAPVQYMEGFRQDDILDYELSRSTISNYVHYTYSFPNETIGFRVSGNYVIRVTEQGDEDAVLFERPFFVTEQAAATALRVGTLALGAGPFSMAAPVLEVVPPQDFSSSPFDYQTCFVRNGLVGETQCLERSSRISDALIFEAQRESAFAPPVGSYLLDLTDLRTSSRIIRIDQNTAPVEAVLEADVARFPNVRFPRPLFGQSIIEIDQPGEADVDAQYVSTQFALIPPDGRKLSQPVYVVGSFTGWQVDPRHEMVWDPDAGQYLGEALVKQGLHEYRYASRDPRLAEALQAAVPLEDNLYTALVYYRDVTLQTDRLIAVDQARIER